MKCVHLGLVVLGLVCVAAACSSENAAPFSPASSSTTSPTSSSTPSDTDGSVPKADGGAPGPDAAAPTNGAAKPSCKYTAHKTGLTSLKHAGGLSFTVYAPASYDPAVGHTVVVIMHGQDSNGVPELQALWQSIADQEQLVLVAPKGSRPATNGSPDGANWATADLDKVLDVVDDVDDCYDVFTKKHILWGFSEGTFYGYLLGIGAAERFSGLAMGGANASFARQNGYPPSKSSWKIPVSHVHGTQDQNPIAQTYKDRDDFVAFGSVFTLHEHAGGHSITQAQVRSQYDDLKASNSP
jgi:poly(3-hydroxybutyrate) depolymerase